MIETENVISGIVVELAKLALEEIKDRIKRRNAKKTPKKRKTRKKKS